MADETPPARRARAMSAGAKSTADKSVAGRSVAAAAWTEMDGDDPGMSFGEPLAVSVTRATSRFQSIQRTYSRPGSAGPEALPKWAGDAEEKGQPRFDLTAWLTGRQQTQGPPFAKRVGLLFSQLSVFGDNVGNRHIATAVTPYYKMLKWAVHGFGVKLFERSGRDSRARQLLRSMSGVVADGEMLLVLGRPGSGCSTLLRVLGNRTHTYRRIEGTVSYGGMSPQLVADHYRGEVAYNQEDDVHFPTLTVRQTLEFAIQCKMPSTRMLQDREGYKREFLDTLLDMYGLAACADTIVGDAFLRGVSGGERKRVSIAEQVASGASVDIWDGSTRGLDSSSALDFVRSLRITTDVLHKSTIVTIYQASENIYDLFDKVMVIDEGRQLYFGPASRAVAYFEALGVRKPARQTTSDFLTGVTQLHERQVVPGFEDSAPRTAEDFERAWLASEQHRELRAELDAFDALVNQGRRSEGVRDFIDQTKMGTGSIRRRKSPYTTTFLFQLRQLLRREAEILWNDRLTAGLVVLFYVAFAVIVGTLFLNLPGTTAGAFTRSGLLFIALVFCCLSVQAEVPRTITGRMVVYKHKSFAMYHPAAMSLAKSISDVGVHVVQIVAFSVILYFTTGLERTAGQFFTFLALILVSVLCMTSFFRVVGSISPTVDVALTLAGVSLLFMIILSGYLQPPQSIHGWFVWIHWIDPVAFAFRALMCNEFRNLSLRCAGPHLVPSGAGFDSIANQVCTLQGAAPGELFVRGRDYIAAAYRIYAQDQWKYFAAVLGFWILYVVVAAVAMEYIEFGNTGYSINVYKRRKPKVDAVTAEDKGALAEPLLPSGDPSDEQILAGTTLTWRDMCYAVPVKGGERQLLDSVSGFIKPGTMTALMGSSGAGKTTLLDALSQRKTIGRLEGEILMNGAPQPRSFRRVTGYCEQLDVHNPFATVREALRFSARLRRPAAVPDSEKNAYVERVIYLLGLTDIADCQIGSPTSGEGISLEERKRLTIGIELVSRPKILFLDEPTSGLDAQASFKIVQFLRRLAAEGQTILCTIHQPSAVLFEQFDRLLLLVRGGCTVYCGDLGPDAQTLIRYFERNGASPCPPTANPAEYILDVVGSKGALPVDWPQTWADSPERRGVLAEIDRINQLKLSNTANQPGDSNSDVDDNDRVYANGHLFQTRVVMRRMFVTYWRNVEYFIVNILLQVICALAVGFTYFNVSDSATDLQNKSFAIFLCSVLSVFIINQIQPEYLRQRQYYTRETSTNQYGWPAFSAAIILVEWPFFIFAGTLFFACFYWTIGLGGAGDRIGYFYISYIALVLFSATLGQAVASFSPDDVTAAMINPVLTTMMTLFCGVTIPRAQMPKFWRRWMYWASPYRYYIEGVLTNDMHGSPVRCRPSELYVFEPPANATCASYAGAWVEAATGYLANPDATAACQYCPYSVGDEYFASLDWSFGTRWRNLGILFAFTAFNAAFTVAMVRVYKANKR